MKTIRQILIWTVGIAILFGTMLGVLWVWDINLDTKMILRSLATVIIVSFLFVAIFLLGRASKKGIDE